MENYNLKHFAHIGDAVWELFARELVIKKTTSQKLMHNMTVSLVNANFQANAVLFLENHLNDEEKEILRRGRNLKITINKRNNPKIHCQATAFEVLLGYFYLNDKKRLEEIFEIIKKNLIDTQNV